MDQEHFRRLERMYLSAPCNEAYRPRISIGNGEAEVAISVGPHLHHAAGAVHGSVYFKIMDDAAFFAVNSLIDDVFALTVSFTVYLLRPVNDGEMIATGKVVNAGRSLWVAESSIEDGRGRVLGRGSGSFMRSRSLLCDAMGYGDDR
jgi:uncharacterized protein (TIGR00369 family)